MESLEVSGKTVEEAIQHALKQLGVSREEVEVSVVKEGKSGILGLGTEEAKDRVKLLGEKPEEDSEVAEQIINLLEGGTIAFERKLLRYNAELAGDGLRIELQRV